MASHGSTLSSYIVKNIALQKVSTVKEDPREALLRHAKAAESDPYWIAPAYTKTQPKVNLFYKSIYRYLMNLRLFIFFCLKPIFQDATSNKDADKDEDLVTAPWKKPKTDSN